MISIKSHDISDLMVSLISDLFIFWSYDLWFICINMDSMNRVNVSTPVYQEMNFVEYYDIPRIITCNFHHKKNNVNFVCSNIICKTLDKSIRYLFASFCNSIIRCHDLRTCTLQLICNRTSDNRDTISG